MKASEAYRSLKENLQQRYDVREAATIAQMLMEAVTGTSRADRLLHDPGVSGEQEDLLRGHLEDLLAGRPIQYVLGHAWFMGEQFLVGPEVLIPRPETEELVQWLLASVAPHARILDIGTGSGCIPIMTSKYLPDSTVYGVDLSAAALALAARNANALGARVEWIEGDFLDPAFRSILPVPDVIISNPPYIPRKDMLTMDAHVVEHEPHIALFVPDDDALVFYRHITDHASRYGINEIFLETHYALAGQVAALGEGRGYRAEVRKDLSGHERMVKLRK